MSESLRLRDVVTIARGSTYKSALVGRPGPVLLGLASIQRNGGFRRDSLRTYGGDSPDRMLVKPGDVYASLKDVTQSADLLGSVARLPAEVPTGRLTQDTVRLDLTSHDVTPEYLYWCLRTPQYRTYCRAHATGTTNLGLPRDDFLNFEIPTPTSERLALIEAIDALDALVDVNNTIRATLDRKGVALIEDLVASRPDLNVIPLRQAVEVIETGRRPRGGVRGIDSGVPSIGAESINGLGVFDFSKTKYVPVEFAAQMRTGVLQSRDVLVYKDGGRPGDFQPHVGMLGDGFPFDDMTINEHVYRLRAAAPLTEPYLYFWLSTEVSLATMRRLGTGAAIPGLNSTALRSIPVAVPPNDTRATLFLALDALVGEALAASAEARQLSMARDQLLPLLWPRRVPDEDVAA